MLSFLEKLASSFWDLINRVISLITPFGRGRDFFRLGPGLRAFLHILILVCVLGGLWWLNQFLRLDEAIVPPSFAPRMRYFWLDILFLLLYAMTWLGWWLWKLLGPEEYGAEFPDIDDAWEEAMKALNDAQIDITDAPLFMVIGKTAGGDDALFHAAQLSLTVKQTPRAPDAPLHLYANRDGIYITCPGACLLGKQSALLTGVEESGGESSGGGTDGDGVPSEEDMFKTLQPKGKMKDVQAILARAREQGRGPEQLTEEEKGEIKLLVAEEESEHAQPVRKPAASLVKNATEVERLSARLKYLCRLVVRDRRPYCPINGLMVLIPFAGSEREEDATNTGTLLQQDLASARSILQVNCPVLALICDLEMAPGFRDFVERFPSDQRQRRLGQRFPLVPDVEPSGVGAMVDGGVGWIAQAMFPNWVYKLFRLESGGKNDLATVVKGNARLYQLLGSVRERQKRLARILARGIFGESSGLPLFGGCYVAGTGREAAREQAFVAGVFRRLIENQNYVSWTDEALHEEEDNQRWTSYGYIGLGVAAAVLAALAFFFWKAKK